MTDRKSKKKNSRCQTCQNKYTGKMALRWRTVIFRRFKVDFSPFHPTVALVSLNRLPSVTCCVKNQSNACTAVFRRNLGNSQYPCQGAGLCPVALEKRTGFIAARGC